MTTLEIPKVTFTLDGYEIQVQDWNATSIENGGYDSFRGVAREADLLRYPSSFEQGAPIQIYLANSRVVWDGTLEGTPIASNGLVELSASGAMTIAEEQDDLLDYQIATTTISDVVRDVGRKLGWDVEGIPKGPPTKTPRPGMDIFTHVKVPSLDPDGKGPLTRGPATEIVVSRHIPGVAPAPFNISPLTWGGSVGGNWAALLDLLASMLTWRWRVLGNVFGRGHVLQFGPYGPSWDIRVSKNAIPSLSPQSLYNVVIVRYRDTFDTQQEVTVRADPDPFKRRGLPDRPFKFDIPDPQADDTLATYVAQTLIDEVSRPRLAGTVDIVGADNGYDDMTIYDLIGGDLATLGDFSSNGSIQPLKVAQVEMSSKGVRLGIERPSSVAGILAYEQRRRKPDATIRGREDLSLTEARRLGLMG